MKKPTRNSSIPPIPPVAASATASASASLSGEPIPQPDDPPRPRFSRETPVGSGSDLRGPSNGDGRTEGASAGNPHKPQGVISEYAPFIPGSPIPSGSFGWPKRPDGWDQPRVVEDWFTRVAQLLLHQCRLNIAGTPHTLREIEFYLHGPGHPDPFTHRRRQQYQTGAWYFHRSGEADASYRGGSFKGLDITCGDENTACGILIRAWETPAGEIVEGPSRCVDAMLAATGYNQVSELDAALHKNNAPRSVWDYEAPVALVRLDNLIRLDNGADFDSAPPFVRSARVGLSLKRQDDLNTAADYLLRAYRYSTAQQSLAKGVPLFVLTLAMRGFSAGEIHDMLKISPKRIASYLKDFALGQNLTDISEFVDCDLTLTKLCRLHGYWHTRRYGPSAP